MSGLSEVRVRELVTEMREEGEHLGGNGSRYDNAAGFGWMDAATLLERALDKRGEAVWDKDRWCPDRCPITMRPFFMWIEHPEKGMVPTYGGPFDSYTIPEPDNLPKEAPGLPPHEIEFSCERYDHDEGAWVEGCEDPGMKIVTEDKLIELGAWSDCDPATPADMTARLMANDLPFGEMPKDMQEAMRKAWNNGGADDSNIEWRDVIDHSRWIKVSPVWGSLDIYRLASSPAPASVGKQDWSVDDFRKIRHGIGLLNSMVRSGERHSDKSARMTVEALEAVERMELHLHDLQGEPKPEPVEDFVRCEVRPSDYCNAHTYNEDRVIGFNVERAVGRKDFRGYEMQDGTVDYQHCRDSQGRMCKAVRVGNAGSEGLT